MMRKQERWRGRRREGKSGEEREDGRWERRERGGRNMRKEKEGDRKEGGKGVDKGYWKERRRESYE